MVKLSKENVKEMAGGRCGKGGAIMAECVKRADEFGKEGLLQDGAKKATENLAVFRWLERQIPNKKAITACLLVLQGSACSEVPLGVNRVAET